jgi:hypothetical protein
VRIQGCSYLAAAGGSLQYSVRHLRDIFPYRFAVKAVEHAQVRNPLNLFPGSKKRLTSFCMYRSVLDLLEPTREDPTALVEAHKVLKLFSHALARACSLLWRS